ncbi:MAG: response regulator, partial [Burkholderiales bacterium]|nr:response regulator [Burkholderiales bacterium]
QRHEQEAEWTRMWQQGSGASGQFELTARHKDGSIRTVLLHRLIVGEEMLLVVMDITDRKRIEDELAQYRDHLESLVRLRTDELETQERFLRHLLQALPGMVAYWDKDFQCRFSNAAYVEWFGAHPDEMTGMSIRQLLGDQLYAENEPYILRALRGEPQHFERSKVKPNGEVGHMLAHYIPDIVNGEVVGFLAVVDDVTRVKESELAAARALAKAEEASRAKGEFLANMSHEIRTPLNGVLGLAQIGYRDSFNLKKVQETFSRILDSGRLLQTIINDILDFSKIEAGKLAIESRPFSPADLVDETVAGVLALAAPKSISVYSEKIDLPAAALGDSLRLSQILYNLLSNAIKFTERGEVKLVAQCQGGELILSVSDTGIGIDSSALNRLFKPFEQADTSTTRQFGGTGLGLTISRRLAVLMDGSLTVESKPSEGSTFTLRVPFKPTNEPVAERKVHGVVGAKRLTGLHILVAEDNQVNQMVIEEMLEGEGAHVVMAQNGQQAVELAQLTSAPFDVVLMDVQMPLMDGLVATRKIKEVHPELPVIGQTAHALKEEMDKCQAAGMAATVNKPIELDDLVAMIIKTIHADSKRRNQPGRPTHIKPPSVPEAPLIDVAALKQRYARKPEFAERLIVAFLRHHLNESSKLRSCALAQDYDGIEEIAHRLKGSTGNIGASAVMRHAHETQELAYAKQAQALDHARQLADMLDKVILVLQSEG